MTYSPPFTITPFILQLCQDISRTLGTMAGLKINDIPFLLRRAQQIKTIQASLAIEGNTLTLDQVTALMNKKRVLGPHKDITEAKNALLVYENLRTFNPLDSQDFLRAHKILMKDLIPTHGAWRLENVGIFKGKEVSHVAPSYTRVPQLMDDLFHFIDSHSHLSWLIKACIFHYEMEFIHPFSDGNGRMGRLWQQLLLMKEDPIFEWIPLEVLIKEHQENYYHALGESDKKGESTPFIEFALTIISQALKNYSQTAKPIPQDYLSRLHFAKNHISQEWFSRKDYLEIHKNISSATASRDLLLGLQNKVLKSQGQKNQAKYCFQEECSLRGEVIS